MTVIDIYNRALDFLGTQSVKAVSDSTNEARLCNRNYDNCRRSVLRAHPWNFAITRVMLIRDPAIPAFDFQYSYTLPADFLRLTKVSADIDDWRLEKNLIISDNATLQVAYVADITDPELWDPMCADAVSLYLAWIICYKITQSSTLKEQIFTDFTKILSK